MRRLLVAIAFGASLASGAGAGDLVLGAESDAWFDDNVYGQSTHEVSDFIWTIAPTFEVTQRWEKASAQLHARPTYEFFASENRLRGFNYDADGALTWQPSPRASLSLSDSFWRFRSLRGFTQGGGAQPSILAGRQRYWRNIAELEFSYRTSPRGTLLVQSTHALWKFQEEDGRDQQGVSAALRYMYLLTPRIQLGPFVSYSRQIFNRPAPFQNVATNYYNASLRLEFQPEKSLLAKISVGPTLIDQPFRAIRAEWTRGRSSVAAVPGTCPLLPGDGRPYDGASCSFFIVPPSVLALDERIPFIGKKLPNDWTYFADVSLEKHWERGSLGLSYRRDTGTAGAIAVASVADTIELSGRYEFSPRLSSSIGVSWENRKESFGEGRSLVALYGPVGPFALLAPVGVVRSPTRTTQRRLEEVRSLGANAFVQYMLTPYLKLESQLFWGDQNAQSSIFGSMNRVSFRIGLDFEYPALRW